MRGSFITTDRYDWYEGEREKERGKDKHVCEEKLLQEKRRRGEREGGGREEGGREGGEEGGGRDTREGERKIEKENCCTT